MKIVENQVTQYIQEPGVDGMYKAVRDAAAICYQTDTGKMKLSPKEFVDNVLLKNGHTRPLEFGTVYLNVPRAVMEVRNYRNPYSKFPERNSSETYLVTTNLRVLAQGDYKTDEEAFRNGYDKNWFGDLEYWCEPTEYHYRRRTFNIICSRGASDDMRTHITLSSMCESTRFCNYSKNKYGGELTFIRPYWINNEAVEAYNRYVSGTIADPFVAVEIPKQWKKEMRFLASMKSDEYEYMAMAREELQPQQLKRIYPLGAKVELRLCGFDDAWMNFFWRRSDEHADPECQIISNIIREKFKRSVSVFSGAKFGDRFLTKDGETAIYQGVENDVHYLIVNGHIGIENFYNDGTRCAYRNENNANVQYIVGKL